MPTSELISMADQFRGLPMSDLIGGPLQAACNAQVMLANATANFIQVVGFEGAPDDAGKPSKTRTAAFRFTRPGERPAGNNDAQPPLEEVELVVPLLALVNVPALSVRKVDITFDMEVKSSSRTSEKTDAQASLDANLSFGWGMFKGTVHIQGSVASHKENTRESDNSAKYHVQVLAEDTGPPEGLARVLDILNTAIVPKVGTVPASNPAAPA